MNFQHFIQQLIKDLHLGAIPEQVHQALELRIGEIVDQQVEGALAQTLTENDWAVYENYKKNHPTAPTGEVFNAMITSRPEIQKAVEDRLLDTYIDLQTRAEAIEQELAAAKTNAQNK